MSASDFTPEGLSLAGSAAKEQVRLRPLDILRQASTRLWSNKDQALACDWMELAGKHAPTLQALLDANALRIERSARFIGVDKVPQIITGCRAHYGESVPARWHTGSLIPALRSEDAFSATGVLVFDSVRGVHGDKTTRRDLDVLARFAHRQEERLSEFMLVINVAGGRFASPASEEAYSRDLASIFDITIRPDAFIHYRSRSTTMLWTALCFGF